MANLVSGRRDTPTTELNSLYQVPKLRPKSNLEPATPRYRDTLSKRKSQAKRKSRKKKVRTVTEPASTEKTPAEKIAKPVSAESISAQKLSAQKLTAKKQSMTLKDASERASQTIVDKTPSSETAERA